MSSGGMQRLLELKHKKLQRTLGWKPNQTFSSILHASSAPHSEVAVLFVSPLFSTAPHSEVAVLFVDATHAPVLGPQPRRITKRRNVLLPFVSQSSILVPSCSKRLLWTSIRRINIKKREDAFLAGNAESAVVEHELKHM